MRFILVLIGILLVTLTSCKKDVRDSIKSGAEADKPYLNFSLKTVDASLMKGTPQKDLEKYNSVSVQIYSYDDQVFSSKPSSLALYGDINLKKEIDKDNNISWEYTPPKYWPDGRKTAFFAYTSDIALGEAGIEVTSHEAGIPTVTYTVTQDVTKQPDLLIATPLVDMTQANNGGANKIKINMNHALSCISFAPMSSTPIKINKIEIRNVYGKGMLDMAKITPNVPYTEMKWDVIGDKSGVTFEAGIESGTTIPDDLSNLQYLMKPDGYLMMVPQKLENAKIFVQYQDGADVIEKTLDIHNEEWISGKKYVYSWGLGGIVTYYEVYDDNKVGLYYYDFGSATATNTIRYNEDADNANIIEAGYGVLSTSTADAKIKWGTSELTVSKNNIKSNVAKIGGRDYNLYPVSQTAIAGMSGPFTLTYSNTPQKIIFNDLPTHGYCLPHFAKGVYLTDNQILQHYIRTPQQMINISENTAGGSEYTRYWKYTQENDLSFHELNYKIGGAQSYSKSIVTGDFSGTYNGNERIIKSMKIVINDDVTKYVGLFYRVYLYGTIEKLTIESSCTIVRSASTESSDTGVGAFVGKNSGHLSNLINYADVTSLNRRNVGGICGFMDYPYYGQIEDCHNIGNIKGKACVGGIVGALNAEDNKNGNYLKIIGCSTRNGEIISTTYVAPGTYVNGTGGICGYIPIYGTNASIEKCYNYSSNVIGNSTAVGGILGLASAAKGTLNMTSGGTINISKCAVYNATIRSSFNNASSIPYNGVGGIVGSSYQAPDISPQIILEDLLFVNNLGSCPITSASTSGNINVTNIHVGGIVGYTDASVTVGNCVYIGVVPLGNVPGGTTGHPDIYDYLYPVVGDDGGSNFTGRYYYLAGGSYNPGYTRYGRSNGYNTPGFISNISDILSTLNTQWESVTGGYPYPKLKAVPIPTGTGWWPTAN